MVQWWLMSWTSAKKRLKVVRINYNTNQALLVQKVFSFSTCNMQTNSIIYEPKQETKQKNPVVPHFLSGQQEKTYSAVIHGKTEWLPLARALKHESDRITVIIHLEGDNIIVISALQHLVHVSQVHARGEVAIAALILLDAIRLEEEEGDECRVAKIHGLERQSNGGTVKIAIIDQVFDWFLNFLQ